MPHSLVHRLLRGLVRGVGITTLVFSSAMAWLTLAPAPVEAASACGGKGERACCVLERVPSCDKGLKESGTCKKNCACGKGPGSSIGMCVKDDDGISAWAARASGPAA